MKKEKLLQKAVNSPQNLRYSEFASLLTHYGFELRSEINAGSGSHTIYKQSEWKYSISIQPDKNGKAKDYQINQFLEVLRRHNVI